MGSDELIANLFKFSQTEQKLKRDNIQTEQEVNQIRYYIGKNIKEVFFKMVVLYQKTCQRLKKV